MKQILKKVIRKISKKIYGKAESTVIYTKELQSVYNSESVCGGGLIGKKALIIDAESGIGFATAKRFLLEGATVVITGRNQDKLLEAKDKLNSENVMIFYWNLTEIVKYGANVEKVVEMLGGLDILINNAGVYTETDKMRRFRTVTEEQFDYVMDINLKSTWFLCQAVTDYMVKNNVKGHIVNIASICVTNENYMHTPYGISKSGIISLTKGLSTVLANHGIVVNGVSTGSVATSMGDPGENDSLNIDRNLIKRVAIPEEIAAIVAFLASHYGEVLTGQVIEASGLEKL